MKNRFPYFFLPVLCLVVSFSTLAAAQSPHTIDPQTLDAWAAPYRGWHYYPEYVIQPNPGIPGYDQIDRVDVPTVYQIPGDSSYYMSFVGFDGQGYQSFVAQSEDLLHWSTPRLAMGFGPDGEFDHGGRVIGAFLYESYAIDAPRVLKAIQGKYWTLYGAYPRQGGYELRPGSEGIASSADGQVWQRAKDEPILSVNQADCGEWEKDCIYQPWLVEHEGKYYNFYNAANGSIEQTGLAFSSGLLEWSRYPHNPILRNTPDGYDAQFCSDPKVFWDKDHWVMFYFGVGKSGAHIMAAFSRDLVHWTVHPEPLYKAGGHPGGLDATYAHKISLVYNPANDTYYMYYCAVGDQGRGIGLLTSRPVVPAAPYEKTSLRASTVQAFPLSAVRLLDSPFKDAMDRDGAYLLQLEPDRLLAGFRENAGLEPKAAKYGGWERDGVAGHSLGHYLSACAMMYASTGDPRFRDRVNTIVEELKPCQDESGYVAAIPNGRKVFAEVAAGDIRSAGFDLNGCWVPWYTLHKLFAGLLDAQAYCHNDEALAIATKLGDWAIQITVRLDETQFQTMLACEHGGMNESLAELYIRTGERKYLNLSYRFHHKTVLDPLAAGEDCLPGKHGNTQIPKIIGVARRYEATGRSEDRAIAEFFWDTVVSDHTYANGGHSDNEHFGPPRKLADRLSNNTSETCNTYNMLKLTRHLFEWTGGLTYADYYEKVLYNHILASQNPDDGMLCYFIPLKSGLFKTYSTPFDSFWCCVGTGMENHAKYGEGVYFHDTNRLLINLFIPSVLTWEEKGLTVQMETAYPQDSRIFLTLGCDKAVDLPLGVRCPAWAKGGFQVKVNGVPRKVESVPGAYTLIPGIWQDGDVVEIAIPMGLRSEPMPDHPERVALFYGPVLLAGDLGSIEGPEPELAPVFLAKKRPVEEWIRPIPGQPLHFLTVGVGRPVDVMLKPFYAMHHRRYGVYWDLFDEAEWAAREAAYLAEKKLIQEIEAKTIDWLRIGEMQPERDHNLLGEKTGVGEFQGRKWRHASDGGWFSFEMKVDPAQAQELWCTYWGSDSGNRTFTISVDGEFLAVQKLNANRPGQFFDEIYPLPQGMLASKEKVTIRFQAAPGNFAGGLFGCRIVKTDTKE